MMAPRQGLGLTGLWGSRRYPPPPGTREALGRVLG